ncbi:polysaccharide deacetylase family protein [Aminipila luticellarii]|uniref:Polysaccharide deacetylase family protein n=1 Tax=Aminipila luticellarii TaxID=2507160 RepID=A0A410PVL8_9FIRM|nr:polysaccharide deacetylase family protein [Aminipila luticellarii]QAT42964.1 polysaccharide deacetylase family protein [Aminipila luticellarii]
MFLKSLTIFLFCILISYSILPTCVYKIKQRAERIHTQHKKLYLTFDDGPDERFTENLLDLLKRHEIRATFFSVAEFAENNPHIMERMEREGHLIGLHSSRHQNGLWQTPGHTRADFERSEEIFRRLGIRTKLFRPPWGHINAQTLACVKQYGYKIVLWDIMAEDWRGGTTWQQIAEKLLRRTQNGDIICLHDGRGKKDAPGRTIKALEEVLPVWISQGYTFARMDEKYE